MWRARPASCARVRYTLTLRQVHKSEIFERRRIGAESVAAGVGRAVIHHDDFVAEADRVADGREGLAQAGSLVVDG